MKKTAPTNLSKPKAAAGTFLPKELTTVTPVTKLLALVVILGSVVLAFTLGRLYQIVNPV